MIRNYIAFYHFRLASMTEQRKSKRIEFEHDRNARMLSADGTWQRACKLLDISASGVQLELSGSLAGLDVKEFFLMLSSDGRVYRRCELVRIDGQQIGARIVEKALPKKNPPGQSRAAVQ